MDTKVEEPNLISAINDCIHDIQFYDGKLKELLEEVTELKEQRKEIVDTLGRYIQNRKQHLQQSIAHSSGSSYRSPEPRNELPNPISSESIVYNNPSSSDETSNTNTKSQSVNLLQENDPNMTAEQRSNILNMVQFGDFFREDAELRELMNIRRKKMHAMQEVMIDPSNSPNGPNS